MKVTNFQEAFAAGIAILRKAANLSQKQLADKSGVTRVTISRTESGSRPTPWDDAYSLAAVFNLTPEGVMAFGGYQAKDSPPSPEVKEYLDKARAVIEAGGKEAATLKNMLDIMKD